MAWSIYVHVPFCVARCGYCSFYSGEELSGMEGYPRLVAAEARMRRRDFPPSPASTLYLGGGTPSLLGNAAIAETVEGVSSACGLEGAEVTVEVNPAAAIDFRLLKKSGVNRVSIGVQSLNDGNLKILGRPHTAKEALDTVKKAVAAELAVSSDLIYGYRGLGTNDLLDSAGILAKAGIVHLSAYSLEEREDSPVVRASPEDEDEQADSLCDLLEGLGLAQYEVSNFARPGRESAHNIGYWEGRASMGLGPGAHGFKPDKGVAGERCWNAPDLSAYRRALLAGEFPPGSSEHLSIDEALFERLFLALRMKKPFDPEKILPGGALSPFLKSLVEAGDIVSAGNGSFTPTRRGLRRADGLSVWLHGKIFP